MAAPSRHPSAKCVATRSSRWTACRLEVRLAKQTRRNTRLKEARAAKFPLRPTLNVSGALGDLRLALDYDSGVTRSGACGNPCVRAARLAQRLCIVCGACAFRPTRIDHEI
jgi:hypothetical protein